MLRLTPDRLDELLERARDVRVLVVGDIMLDRYLRGSASRISPEAPVPVVRVTEEWRALGGAANVASNAVSLGAHCVIAGCVGTDAEAYALREALTGKGIDDVGLVEARERPTTVKTRVIAKHHQVARYDREDESEIDAATAEQLSATVRRLAATVDAVALEDYDKGVLVKSVIESVLEGAGDIPVIVDPKARGFFDYAGATVFKPNLGELEAALRTNARPDDPAWMDETRRRMACRHLLLTLGEEGMSLITETGEFLRVPTVARAVYDVSGAGDTVTAALAVAMAAGATPAEAAILANHAAGIEVGKLGVATVSPDELRTVVREHAADPDRGREPVRINPTG
jgi:D-beta-D-heptose 7-phosphate kinase/D-beta-D-heptose 1-phosphate adenosyltransferase